jgi:hypothetical protein
MTEEHLHIKSIEEVLEIVIPTYDRPRSIHGLVIELAKSKLSKCRITILDNNSPDTEWMNSESLVDIGLPNACFVSRPVNIGAVANVMQAYEIATKEYLWVLCDDDITDFTDAKIENVNQCLLFEKPDCCIVGTPYYDVIQKDSMSKRTIAKYENVLESMPVVLSFIPSAILRVEWLHSCDYSLGYKLAKTYFPQFFWISRVISEDARLCVTSAPLVVRSNVDTGFGSALLHFMYYAEAACTIKSQRKRKNTFRVYFSDRRLPLIIQVLKLALSDKARLELPIAIEKQVLKEVLGINYSVFSLLFSVIKLLPSQVIKYAIQIKNNNK